MDFIAGETLYIDKPLTWTSFDAVNKIRFMLKRFAGIKKIKVGHAGTLDPLATGLIIVCTGKATKRLNVLMDHDKEYEAVLQLGSTTPSFDLETEIDATFPTEHITRRMVDDVLAQQFTGSIIQEPPMFSAIRIDGHRAYEYARKGRHDDIKLEGRQVVITSIEVISFENNELKLRIACSKGTYIRALARDIGKALGSGAHLTALRRTRVGMVSINDAVSLEQVEEMIKNYATVEDETTILKQ